MCCYCPGTGKLFDSRSDWYEHEREIHRREWVCSSHGAFTSASLFRHHLENDHHGSLLDDQTRLRFMIDRAEQTIQSEQSCPLCGKDGLSPRGLRGHLGRHMQQIALFILGPGEEDDDEDVGCGDVDGDEDEDDDDDEEEGEVKEDDLIQEQETRGSEEEEAHLPEEQQRLLNVEPLQSTKDEGILFQTEQNNSDEIWRIHHTGEFTVCGDCWSRIVEPTPYSEYFDLIVKENGDKHKCDLEQEEWKQLWERRYRLWDFGEFLKMVGLKHKLEEIRLEKADTVEEMREKSVRRGLFPDERRRFRNLLALVEKEEGDVKYSLDRMFFTI